MTKVLVFCLTLLTSSILVDCSTTVTCGANSGAKFGILTSPNYPNNYVDNHECITVITVPNTNHNTALIITILDMDIESHSNCNFDYLEVIDGASSSGLALGAGKYCGKQQNIVLHTSSNVARIKLKTDGSVVKAGFRLAWRINDAVTCGTNTYANTGILISPNYPANYLNTHVCTTVITVSAGRHLEFTLVDADIESHDKCDFDYVEFIEGNGHVFGKYCKKQQNIKLSSMTNTVTIKFKTDHSVVRAGFQLTWKMSDTVTCGTNTNLHYGILYSPYYPMNYVNAHECITVITVPAGKRIQLTLVDMDLESHSTCGYDYLEVIDGTSSSGNVIGKYCGRSTMINLQTATNSARIKFKTDHSVVKAGFRLSWKISGTTTCGTHSYSEQGILVSPNYPTNYVNTHLCTSIIEVPAGKHLHINIEDMDIEDHSHCGYDHLKITEGRSSSGSVIGNYCGKKRTTTKLSTSGNVVRIEFKTDGSVVRAGFRLSWTSYVKIVGQWMGWSAYSNTCFGWKNNGMKARKRVCNVHRPKVHDRYCTGSAIEITNCPSTTTTTEGNVGSTCDVPTYTAARNQTEAVNFLQRIISYIDAKSIPIKNSVGKLHNDILSTQSDIIHIEDAQRSYHRSNTALVATKQYIESISSGRSVSSVELSSIRNDLSKFATFSTYLDTLLGEARHTLRKYATEKTKANQIFGQLTELARDLRLYTDDVDFDLDPELAEEEVITMNAKAKGGIDKLSTLFCST